MSWLLSSLGSLTSGFVPQMLTFGELQVVTTALLAEGGYSYVYTAKQVSTANRQYAVKKVLAQDAETRAIAEVEAKLLEQLDGVPGFVGCHGTMSRAASGGGGAREFWMLLEYCPHGSLIDVVYTKNRAGEYERGPPLTQERVLEIFEGVVGAVAHLHQLQPPVAHRDLKLENVLQTEDGRFVLCDFGSATREVLSAGRRSRRDVAGVEEAIEKYSTQMYRAPEMVDLLLGHEVGPKVDVWALGCMLYTMCFGAHPFAAESSLQILNGAYSIPGGSPYSESIHDLVTAIVRAANTAVVCTIHATVVHEAHTTGREAHPAVICPAIASSTATFEHAFAAAAECRLCALSALAIVLVRHCTRTRGDFVGGESRGR